MTAPHVLYLVLTQRHGARAAVVQVLAMPHPHLRLVLMWTWRGPDGGLRRALWGALTGGKANSGWHVWHGPWWAFQMSPVIGPVNLGVHLDLRARRTASGRRYGPYLDLHLPFCIASVGVNPVYSGDLDLVVSSSRGGLDGVRH